MAIELCVLASGSAGNCTILRTPAGAMLIDAGIGPRVAATRMNGTGVKIADIRAICLTHLDRDHFNYNWITTAVRHQIPIFCHSACVNELLHRVFGVDANTPEARAFASVLTGFDGQPFQPLPGLVFQPVHLAHDREGSHGFVIEGHDRRIGYATDLGHVPAHLLEAFCGLDVLAIESNYDPQMQMNSPRPAFLKHRITGGRGHLSNHQALDAVRKVLDRCEQAGQRLPEHIVLLHRSRECNCPNLLRAMFSRDARIAPRLTLSEQLARTEWIRPRHLRPLAGEQLQLAWG